MSQIYPSGDHQVTPNLGLGLWGTDEVTSDNMILIDTAFGSVGGSIKINGSVVNSPNFVDSASVTFGVVGSNISLTATGGTVSSFSAGTLSPLFTTSVANPTTTPALTFSLSNAGGGTIFGNNTTGSASPAYTIAPVLGIPGTSTGSLAIASSTASGLYTLTAPANAATPTLTLPITSNVLAGQFAGDGTIFNSSLNAASAAGTLTPTLLTQTANFALLGPTSGAAAAPTFRALVTADIPSGTVLWNQLGNAAGSLTLANAGNATTFQQTANTAWTWENITTATVSTTNGSPVMSLKTQYWTGAASAADTWTIGSQLTAGTNGTPSFVIDHSGSTGTKTVSFGTPVGAGGGTWTFQVGGRTFMTQAGNAVYQCDTTISSGSTTINGSNYSNVAGAASVILKAASTYQGTSGTSLLGQIIGTFSPTSGTNAFCLFEVKPTINQTVSASGSYTGLRVNAVETALLGTNNLLLDLQAGTTGGTSKFSITNGGHVNSVADFAGQATITAGGTTKAIAFTANYIGAGQPIICLTPTSDPTVAGVVQGYWITYSGSTGAWTGFTVNIQAALAADVTFNYIVIGNR